MTARFAVGLGVQGDRDTAFYAALAQAAEAHGFDGASVFADLGYQPALYPLLVLALHSRRLRLGPAALNPFTLHPVEIAGQIAALDAASGGRAYLGLTRGAWLGTIGQEQTRPLRRLREAIEVVRRLLAGDDGGYDGEVFALAAGTRLHWPVPRARVPLLVGAWGPRAVALAGEVADELKVGGSANPAMVTVARDRLRPGVQRAGRDPAEVGIVLGAVTVTDHDGGAARRRARTAVAMYLDVVAPLDPTVELPDGLLEGLRSRLAAGDHPGAGALVGDDLLASFAFAGTPAQVAAQAEALRAAGAARVEFGPPWGLDDPLAGVDLLGREVLPRLR